VLEGFCSSFVVVWHLEQRSRSENGYIFILRWRGGKVPESFGHSSELCNIKCKWLGQVLLLVFFASALEVARSALLYW